MSNYDAWLEQPFQDSLRHGEELEALEDKYRLSDDFDDSYEIWRRDCLPEYLPSKVSWLDLYLGTDEYREGLDAFIEAEAKAQEDEWAVYDSPESDEALRAWDEAPVLSRRKRIVRLLAKVVGR
jgi:hypothetical protein